MNSGDIKIATSCDVEAQYPTSSSCTPPQRTRSYVPHCDPSHKINSSPPSPPVSLSVTVDSMDSDADEDIFPITPDSKHSCPTHRFTSAEADSPTPSRSTFNDNDLDLPHTLPSVDKDHGDNNSVGGSLVNVDKPNNNSRSQPDIDKFTLLKRMEVLSPKAKRFVVRYKEAVRERKRMRFFATLWKREEIKRLDSLYDTICEDLECDLTTAEEECRFLSNTLSDRPNVQHLNALREDDKKSLRRADAELIMLRETYDNDITSSYIHGIAPVPRCAAS
ncbi:hypothetical protein BDR04DRAFT_1164464 [Suillus decipiens]|nr:hypothetical protein BDR04DRAFT_1164464 [Suillus decipiens]